MTSSSGCIVARVLAADSASSREGRAAVVTAAVAVTGLCPSCVDCLFGLFSSGRSFAAFRFFDRDAGALASLAFALLAGLLAGAAFLAAALVVGVLMRGGESGMGEGGGGRGDVPCWLVSFQKLLPVSAVFLLQWRIGWRVFGLLPRPFPLPELMCSIPFRLLLRGGLD